MNDNNIRKLIIRQNLLSALLLVFCFLLVSWITPEIVYEPRGLAYQLDDSVGNEAIAMESVAVLPRKPYGAELVGKVIAEMSVRELDGEEKRRMLSYAQKLAASLGANALVLELFGTQGEILLLEGAAVKL